MGKRRRHNRNRGRYGRNTSHYRSRKRAGWGMNLYRNTREGMIAGVASGMAAYWDIAPWVVRLLWIGAFIFTGTLALWAYLAAWILLAPRPTRSEEGGRDEAVYEEVEVEMEYDERHHDYRPRKVFRYSDSSSVRLKRARERLDAALRRVEDMESYVTSRQYNLNKEFSKL